MPTRAQVLRLAGAFLAFVGLGILALQQLKNVSVSPRVLSSLATNHDGANSLSSSASSASTNNDWHHLNSSESETFFANKNNKNKNNLNSPRNDPEEAPDFNRCPEEYTVNRRKVRRVVNTRQEGVQADDTSVPRDQTILILTPISDFEQDMHHYLSMLCSLTYPHRLISVAFGECSSSDNTWAKVEAAVAELGRYFRSMRVHKLSDPVKDKVPPYLRHEQQYQETRRRHLAHVRNELLLLALGDVPHGDGLPQRYDWVLWLDSDLFYYPPNIIELLLGAEEDVVAPACLGQYEDSDDFIVYDKNTWQETEQSRRYLADKPATYLMLEGYSATKRKYLSHLRGDAKKVPLDGVGGCTLLVRARCHRMGLFFPPFVFENHIETEGLGKMATQMGFSVYGLPYVSVFHKT